MKKSLTAILLILLIALIVSCTDSGERGVSTTPKEESPTSSFGVSDMQGTTPEEATDRSTPLNGTSKAPENGFTVCIDAGHQKKGISEKEPNGPGSSVMKAKLTSGTSGAVTKIPEYVLTLEVSLMLKEELLARGYKVVMIRETHDCPKSNAERAILANESGADIFIRIHANGSTNQSAAGALTCAPTAKNEFLTSENINESIRLSRTVIDEFCKVTGARNRGIMSTDTMTGINWCKIPVTIVEMGFMSNPEEDRLMATGEYRIKMVRGMANGIDSYFKIS